jgi:hypothetical protein
MVGGILAGVWAGLSFPQFSRPTGSDFLAGFVILTVPFLLLSGIVWWIGSFVRGGTN